MKITPHSRTVHRLTSTESCEDGYMLLAVVVMAALVLIALSVAAPLVARDLRRDKEVESAHRAQQYVRAIQLFYKKNNGYPPSIKSLEGTNNIRYLRQQYVDPLTGEANWRLIHLGEQKTTVKGFFGKELGGIASGGLGSAASLASAPGTPVGGSSTSTIGATSALASGFSGASITTGSSGAAGSTGAAPGSGAASGSGTGSSGTSAFGDGTGGVIVGVGTAKTGDSILQPNEQTTYETWEFWYDPRIELLKKNVNILGGGIASQSASQTGSDAVTGQPNGTSGAGAAGPAGTTNPTATPAPGSTPNPQ